jgi:hypothetical protein
MICILNECGTNNLEKTTSQYKTWKVTGVLWSVVGFLQSVNKVVNNLAKKIKIGV